MKGIFLNVPLFILILFSCGEYVLANSSDLCYDEFEYEKIWRQGTITTWSCDDYIFVEGIVLESKLLTQQGADSILAEQLLRSEVLTGDGDDFVSVVTSAYDSKVVTGSGSDTVLIGERVTRLILDTGLDDDEVLVAGDVYEGGLNTGSGNDALYINGLRFVRGRIDMGSGYDYLYLAGVQKDYDIQYRSGRYVINRGANETVIYNVERIVFGDGRAFKKSIFPF